MSDFQANQTNEAQLQGNSSSENKSKFKDNSQAFKEFRPGDIAIRHNTRAKQDSYTMFVPKDLVNRPFARDENGNFIEETGIKKNGEEYTYKQRINFVAMPQGTQLRDETSGQTRDVSGWSFVPFHKAVNNSPINKDVYEISLLANSKNQKTGEEHYFKLYPPRGSRAKDAGESLITKTIPLVTQLTEQGAKVVQETAPKEQSEAQKNALDKDKASTKERVTARAIGASKSKSAPETPVINKSSLSNEQR